MEATINAPAMNPLIMFLINACPHLLSRVRCSMVRSRACFCDDGKITAIWSRWLLLSRSASFDLVQTLGQLDCNAPRSDDHRGGDGAHGCVSFLVRPGDLDASCLERFAEHSQVLHFKSDVIYDAAGGGDM